MPEIPVNYKQKNLQRRIPTMKTARFVLKIVAASLAFAAAVCAVIAYSDKLGELCVAAKSKMTKAPSEYEDYED